MKTPTYITVYDNALSYSTCNKIIEYIDSQDLVRGTYGNGKLDLSQKAAWQVNDTHFNNNHWVGDAIVETLRVCTNKYRQEFPQLNVVNRWTLMDSYTLKKFDPGEAYFASHCENGGNPSSWTGVPVNRMLVWMIYLNTVTDGGGTMFDQYDFITDAIQGRCVLWPAYWTHFHRGIVSDTQTKYIATGWFGYG